MKRTATRRTRRSSRSSDASALASVGPTATPAIDIPDELIVNAGKQLTIRCGESSITLTAAGKIILRGKYIVSRSSGVQRIKGGSVQIN